MKIKKDNIEISSPKAVVFARVSSREQEQGQSIEAQLENIYRYCKRKEIQILKEYKITESSTRGERKKFNEMLNFVKTQKNKVLIISECVDRIQRSFKESISLDELMQKDKIELHFVRECLILSKESETTDISRWDFSVMAAKTYVGNLRDNVNRSMRYILEHGRWQHYAPLGYMNVRDASGQADIVLDPERAPLIKYLFEEYATGNYSLRSLADLANEIGLTARRSKNKTICKNSVFTFLKNPFYYGIMVEKNKYYEHHHEKLIDKSLFDKVQEVLAGRKVSPTKMTYREREFATRGIVKCSCGCSITPEYHCKPSGKEYIYIKCSHYYKDCKQIGMNENVLLRQFETEIFDELYLPDNIRQEQKKEVRRLLDIEQQGNNNTKKLLDDKLIQLKENYNRLLDLYIGGRIGEDIYERKVRMMKEEEAGIKESIIRYSTMDTEIADIAEALIELAGNAKEIFTSSKPLAKNQFLRLLVSNCVLDNKKARISLSEPFNLLLKTPSCLMWSE